MNRLAIFDCDGTIVDSQHTICGAMEEAFAKAGLPAPARERTRRVVGLSLVEAMRAMLPDAEAALHASLAEDYKRAFHAMRGRGEVDEPLYEGIVELIQALDEGGWLLGVATFVTLQTADRHPSKPHPSMIEAALAESGAAPELSMMIGDTSFDMAMAKAAGVTAVGVTWGYHGADELLAAGADHVASHPSEIARLVEAFA
ncbi:MAG: HAD family hydrolase [Alphaproteobacteria bacterium]|nr:MAG: HAD family hydrolase [Alphaproteobacteria bacterium]